MRKAKMFLAGLCMSSLLFSAAPSFALHSGLPPVTEENSYEEKVGKVVDYLKEFAMCRTNYGLHPVTLRYNGDIRIDIGEKGNMDTFPRTEFIMVDTEVNGYGSLDRVLDDKKNPYHFELVNLTKKEKESFNQVYREIIDKFYAENKEKIAQKEQIDKLFDILKNK